jgi:hypothetical protein
MRAPDRITSVPVHASTRRVLQEFKMRAQSWDDFLLQLIEREMDRQDVAYAHQLLEDFRSGKVKAGTRRPRSGRA